ncbi:hypothetical protein UY3_11196 [Chelonia mydas]|uniref:Uncharacterized protein n=1 Tax=Chelonia mydas TaxID=8469 RepID=M7B3M9_CHEMY|nr:hypothetical protein UY3_11196 [Chelonia mydas]
MNPDCPRDGPQLSHGTNPGYDEDGSGILDRANEDWRHRTTGTLEHTGTLEQDAMIIRSSASPSGSLQNANFVLYLKANDAFCHQQSCTACKLADVDNVKPAFLLEE